MKVFAERAAISFSDRLRPLLSPAGTFWYGEDRPLFAPPELAAIARDAAELGFPVAIHAIGDAAVETALAALDLAGEKALALRPMVLHNLFLRGDLLPEFVRLDVVAGVESTNACFVDVYDDLLPTVRQPLVPVGRSHGDEGAHRRRQRLAVVRPRLPEPAHPPCEPGLADEREPRVRVVGAVRAALGGSTRLDLARATHDDSRSGVRAALRN